MLPLFEASAFISDPRSPVSQCRFALSSPKPNDGSLVMALRRNEAWLGEQVVTFQIQFVATSDRPNPLSIGEPPQTLDLSDTRTTSLGLRTCRFATVEAATRLARLRFDLAAAAGPSLGSAKAPAPTPVWRPLVGYQHFYQ